MFLKLNGYLLNLKDLSFVGKMDKHINQSATPAAITHYFVIVIGGQTLELKDMDKGKTEDMRTELVNTWFQRIEAGQL